MIKDSNKIYTKDDFISQLREMNIPRDKVVLVHSSLRLIGKTECGAATLLDALIEYFTQCDGLLCVPTHTWGNIEKEITLDMNDPSTCLGAFSDFAAGDPRGIRSENPTHSMVVFGNRERALDFISDETRIPSGTAPNSCYGKLYSEGGYVLLIGVSHNKNTYLHSVEEMLGMSNRLTKEPLDVAVKLKSGEVVRRKIKMHHTDFSPDISMRFPQYETAFRYHGAITDGFIGNAPAQACDTKIMKEVMEKIWINSGKTDVLRDENAIAPKLYC